MKLFPILSTGLYAFEHALHHYQKDDYRDHAFAILHADHAIELIIKAKVANIGESIINKDGRSLGFYQGIKILKAKACLSQKNSN